MTFFLFTNDGYTDVSKSVIENNRHVMIQNMNLISTLFQIRFLFCWIDFDLYSETELCVQAQIFSWDN